VSERIVAGVATRLESEFGRGFGENNLRRMIQFAEQFPDQGIVAALMRQLESKLHEAMRRARLRSMQSGHDKEFSMT
jgi:hypothetical protein